MKYDLVIKEVIQEVKEEFGKKGIEFSEQEIYTMCDMQFKAMHFAFRKGIDIRIPIFGTFRRKNIQDITKSALEITKIRDTLNDNEFSDAILQAKLAYLKKQKDRKLNKRKVQTLDEIKELKDFKLEHIKFKKLLEDE